MSIGPVQFECAKHFVDLLSCSADAPPPCSDHSYGPVPSQRDFPATSGI